MRQIFRRFDAVHGTLLLSLLCPLGAFAAAREYPLFAILLWLTGIVAAGSRYRFAPVQAPVLSRAFKILAVAVLVVGMAFRFIALEKVPTYADGDEGRQGLFAAGGWLHDTPSGKRPAIFDFGWNALPNGSFILQNVISGPFGFTLENQRRGSAVWGELSLVALLVVATTMFGPMVGLVAVAFLAFNRNHVEWSRIAASNIQVCFFYCVAVLFAFRALRSRAPADALWAGIVGGLGLYSYHAGRAIPFILGAWALWRFVRVPWDRRFVARGLALFFAGYWIAAGPLLLRGFADPIHGFAATNNRTLQGEMLERFADGKPGAAVALLVENIGITVSGIAFRPGTLPFAYPGPLLDPFTAVAFALGIVVLWRRRREGGQSSLVAVWVLMTLFLGSVMTVNPPHHPRLVGVFPALCLVAALGLVGMLKELVKLGPMKPIAVVLGFAIVVTAGWVNWRNYFVDFPNLQRVNGGLPIANFIGRIPKHAKVILAMTKQDSNCDEPTIAFSWYSRGISCAGANSSTELFEAVRTDPKVAGFVLVGVKELAPAVVRDLGITELVPMEYRSWDRPEVAVGAIRGGR